MSSATRTRVVSFVTTLIIVPLLTIGVILFARGYRPDLTTKKIEPTGILAATSHPDGAQVWVDDVMKTATNNSINLPPGTYNIKIKKEGFQPWTKTLVIDKETVTRANPYLFATIPILKPATTAGVISPVLAPSQDKLVYISQDQNIPQLMFLDLTESPLGLSAKEPRILINNLQTPTKSLKLSWSPDSRQILLQASSSARLLDINSTAISEVSISLPNLLNDWDKRRQEQYHRQLNLLPEDLKSLLATTSAQISWSSNDKKILYTATASAVLPNHLIPPIPGSSTQTQTRQLNPGTTYIYDLEEDRHFAIGQTTENWHWYPTGNHVYKLDSNSVTIKEYDNGNSTVVFAGPIFENFAIPFPSGKQLLVLTNPNPASSTLPNLYSVNLK